jgi:hypothetical protein
MSRKLSESISRVVRDSDIMARVSDHEFHLLLPETDALGARMFVRRSQAAFQADTFIAEMSRDYPVSISMGAATFPIDGADFDGLLQTCRDEMGRARTSLIRRLQLEPQPLWEVVRTLVGRPSDHLGPLVEADEAFRLAEDGETGSAHGIFSDPVVSAIEEEVCRQAVDTPERRAVVYAVGGTVSAEPREVERALEEAERARAFLVTAKGSEAPTNVFASVTRVFVDDPGLADHRLLLVLGERVAYAFLGRRGDEGSLYGFHSHDQYLVENLIAKLQEHFNFQRQY